MLLVNVPPAPDEAALLADRRIPLVLLGASLPGVHSVAIDDVAAARSATNHLLDLGHRRLGLISGRPYERIPFTAPPERKRGFLLALKEARRRPGTRTSKSAPTSRCAGHSAWR